MPEPVVRARKGHGFSPAARDLIRKRKLEYFARERERLRKKRRKKLKVEFQALLSQKSPIDRTFLEKHHAALLMRAHRFSGSYPKFVEEVLGLPYSKVMVSREEAIQRNRTMAQERFRNLSVSARIQLRRKLLRAFLWKNQRKNLRIQVLVLRLRLQGYTLRRIAKQIKYTNQKSVSELLADLKTKIKPEVRDRLIAITADVVPMRKQKRIASAWVLSPEEARAIAEEFRKQETIRLSTQYARVKQLALTGLRVPTLAEQLGLSVDEVRRVTRMFPESTHQRWLKAMFRPTLRRAVRTNKPSWVT